MARNLVICCDGTDCQFGQENSSVVRLVEMLEHDRANQFVYYDPGVGTMPEPGFFTRAGKKRSILFGYAFGAGLTRKVEEAYAYLMEMWRPGDQVFLFGYSRGAYTVRVLAGLLHSLGLLPRGANNMIPYVMRLFSALRSYPSSTDAEAQRGYWKLCDEFRGTFARPVNDDDPSRRFPVRFLGVWDTVSSVGWIWDPTTYPFTKHNPSIEIIRHAVSIDERRWFYRSNGMEPVGNQDFDQQWFAGVHGDLGGSYPEQDGGLWRLPYAWILQAAEGAGILVNAQRKEQVLSKSSVSAELWDDRQHESLHGCWWLLEFFPKMVTGLNGTVRRPRCGWGRYRFIEDGQKINGAALNRIKDTHYSPANMSPAFLDYVRSQAVAPSELPYFASGQPAVVNAGTGSMEDAGKA